MPVPRVEFGTAVFIGFDGEGNLTTGVSDFFEFTFHNILYAISFTGIGDRATD